MIGKGISTSILDILPHRFPFLLVDRVTEAVPGKYVLGYKLVSRNDWFVTDRDPSMPGMLVVEALAQLGAFAVMTDGGNGIGFLTSFKNIEFPGAAVPGDRVELRFELIRNKRGFILGRGEAEVDGKTIVRAEEIMFYIQTKE